jgi:hypothetical protein
MKLFEAQLVKNILYFMEPERPLTHVRWVPHKHGMARAQVADEKDGLQTWRVAANIFNN